MLYLSLETQAEHSPTFANFLEKSSKICQQLPVQKNFDGGKVPRGGTRGGRKEAGGRGIPRGGGGDATHSQPQIRVLQIIRN